MENPPNQKFPYVPSKFHQKVIYILCMHTLQSSQSTVTGQLICFLLHHSLGAKGLDPLPLPLSYVILTLLDYVSRAHEIEVCPSSVRPSSVSQLSLNVMHGFLSNFICSFSWTIRRGIFFVFIYFIFFTKIFGNENFKTLLLLKIIGESFQTFLNFLLIVPHKTTLEIFEILKIEILTIIFSFSLTWDPTGANISKTLLLLQVAAESFQTFPEFSSQWSSQNHGWDF